MQQTKILQDISNYYTQKIIEHGVTPQGVDWNGEDGQVLRFKQLGQIISNDNTPFTLCDVGCGYGALYDYLQAQFEVFSYEGVDISSEMIMLASKRTAKAKNASFVVADVPTDQSDYVVASGIFNVKLNNTDEQWKDYLLKSLSNFNSNSKKGFAFNCLTSYSDKDKKRAYLYYADPCEIFDFCKKNFSHQVALLHDYGLFEFTILVRK